MSDLSIRIAVVVMCMTAFCAPRAPQAQITVPEVEGIALEEGPQEGEELRPFTEEEKAAIRANCNNPFITRLVASPRWIPDEKDIALAMKESASPFAMGLGLNRKMEWTEELITFILGDLHTGFTQGAFNNPGFPIARAADAVRSEPKADSAYYALRRTDFPFDPEIDREIARRDVETCFARGAIEHPDYRIGRKDKELAREHVHSPFADVAASKEEWQVDEADRETIHAVTIIHKPIGGQVYDIPMPNWETQFAYHIAQKEDFQVTQADVDLIRSPKGMNSNFAVLSSNPNYFDGRSDEELEADRTFAYENHNSMFAINLLDNPRYYPSERDREVAHANLSSYWAEQLPLNPNYQLTDEDIALAEANPDTWFAQSVRDRLE